MGQPMLEPVFDVTGGGVLVDELGRLQVAQQTIELIGRLPRDLAHQR